MLNIHRAHSIFIREIQKKKTEKVTAEKEYIRLNETKQNKKHYTHSKSPHEKPCYLTVHFGL